MEHFSDHNQHYQQFYDYYQNRVGDTINIMPITYLSKHPTSIIIIINIFSLFYL